jgi:hypothetical protein
MLHDLLKALRDKTQPENRVLRKTAGLTVILIGAFIYYRHIVLGFSLGRPLLITALFALIILFIAGLYGGIFAAAFYESFLKDVDAQNKKLTIAVFFTEWLFALTAPLLGVLIFLYMSLSNGE